VLRGSVRFYCLGLLVLQIGCAPLVEADFSDVEVTRPDVPVPAAPISAPSSVTFTFSFDSTKLGANPSLAAQSQVAEVKLHRLDLTAKGGVVDWSFIQTFHALAFVPMRNVSSPTATVRQVEIADYVRNGAVLSGTTFSVPLPEPVDLLPLVRPRSSEYRKIIVVANLGGQMPAVDWTVDVLMSISVKLKE